RHNAAIEVRRFRTSIRRVCGDVAPAAACAGLGETGGTFPNQRGVRRGGTPRRTAGQETQGPPRLPNIREEARMLTQTETDVQQISQTYATEKSTDLRNRLVERYLPLVKYNAERIWSRLPVGVELYDLISAGIFGLMVAIEAFDINRGVKFETYC